jgi:hypothetical protein
MDPVLRTQYKQAVFRFEPLPVGWPAEFAVITAYDPEGRVTDPADNEIADQVLAAELRGAGYCLHRIVGQSPDGTHQEPGWAVTVGLPGAIEFGRRFGQLAIFYIRQGRLTLVDCDDGAAEDLGRDLRSV